jgi:branched-subunit amino acid aminotransferase/4-amino-4-deoxychorismate lyase
MTKDLIYIYGRLVPPEQATISASSAGGKYGANVFEGICCYGSRDGAPNLFRVNDHLDRLDQSVRIMRIESGFSHQDFEDALQSRLRGNAITVDAHLGSPCSLPGLVIRRQGPGLSGLHRH